MSIPWEQSFHNQGLVKRKLECVLATYDHPRKLTLISLGDSVGKAIVSAKDQDTSLVRLLEQSSLNLGFRFKES